MSWVIKFNVGTKVPDADSISEGGIGHRAHSPPLIPRYNSGKRRKRLSEGTGTKTILEPVDISEEREREKSEAKNADSTIFSISLPPHSSFYYLASSISSPPVFVVRKRRPHAGSARNVLIARANLSLVASIY